MRLLFTLIVIVILAGAGYYFLMQSAPTGTTDQDIDVTMDMDAMPTQTGTTGASSDADTGVDGSVSGEVREITVTSTGMAFDQKTLAVKKGERVRITYQNGGGTHDFRIDGYDVGTQVISGGESETFEFVADEAGEFQYYCSVGNHRAMGMWGTLTVEE